ncbi:hypothetical protein F5877DRAFT_85909 [Lentinula edodes]|nr:hypothetical protein F5877DRAFT_85909 [Lentinula edodes]
MVNKPKSQALRAQITRGEKDKLEKEAVQRYKEEQQRELADGERRKGARKICEEVSNSHFAATGKRICLSYGTLINHTNGGKTISKFNQSKRWLYPNEEKVIVQYAVEMAERGFLLSP